MEKDNRAARELSGLLTQAFADRAFLRRLGISQTEARRLLRQVDWEEALRPLLPIRERLSCAQILELARPMLDAAAQAPEEGWLSYTYHVAVTLLFPSADRAHTSRQWDAALCFLRVLQVLLDEERRALPFDPLCDFAFCTEEELKNSLVAAEYRQFLQRFRDEHVYELLRLGREVTPFHTLEHIAGVHHVAMTVARAFAAGGGCVDLPLMSGAAAGHDLGKFGCREGERVPYLHYYYTNQWFSQRGLDAIGHIAANHSVWDLEIENLSSESLILVYSDFRVKQSRDESGNEIARIYSLAEAFDVILSKLDNVNAAKRQRYRFVYAKLRDFEEYLLSFGVDVTLQGRNTPPLSPRDPALLCPDDVVVSLRRMAVDHNIRLMHRLGHEQLFGSILESARGEKDWGRLRAYVSVFEEYFTYWTPGQKEQTLDFLYELLMYPDGDIRRQAAALIGRILAGFRSGYKKELPADAPPDPEEDRPFQLWSEYLQKLIHPDRRLTPRQTSMIRYQAKTAADALLESCSDADAPRFAAELFRQYRTPARTDADAAFALMDAVVNLPFARIGEDDLMTLAGFAAHWLRRGGLPQKAAALRLFRHLLTALPAASPTRRVIAEETRRADCGSSTPLLFLQVQVGTTLGLDMTRQEAQMSRPELVSSVFLDNLKTATHWVLKAVGVEYLLDQVEHGNHQYVMHIATHFSNLIKVSENVVVRRMAGAALLSIAPLLSPDRRNEIAVELSKSLETGQSEISKYIPEYLGRFSLWLEPRELDEVIAQLELLLTSSNPNVVAASLSTVGSTLEYYAVYGERFGEGDAVLTARKKPSHGAFAQGAGLRPGPGAPGEPAHLRRGALRLPDHELRGEDLPFHPHRQKAAVPDLREPGIRAHLLLHRRRPEPHLPLHRLSQDRRRPLPLPHPRQGGLLPRHLRPLLPVPQGHRPGHPQPGL
jgi:hypothetical protein